jgi:hypothetical protein
VTGKNGIVKADTANETSKEQIKSKIKYIKSAKVYHRERILETSTLSCNEEEEEITKPPKR